MTEADTDIPRSRSIFIQSDCVRRRSPRAATAPAALIAPPASKRFSVSVVFPASGWEMIAKVRRRAISRAALLETGLWEDEVVKSEGVLTCRERIGNSGVENIRGRRGSHRAPSVFEVWLILQYSAKKRRLGRITSKSPEEKRGSVGYGASVPKTITSAKDNALSVVGISIRT